MRKPRIVVTSAAGHTGGPAVLELLKRGYPVRAFVYREDHRSEALKDAGAEIFVGDLNDMRDLRDAMKDVQRAYHCPPFSFGLLHNAMLFALAAEEARLECVVLLSQWQPHEIHPSIVSREHWIANNIYRWMPSVEVIHLNPGLFAFTYLLGLPAVARPPCSTTLLRISARTTGRQVRASSRRMMWHPTSRRSSGARWSIAMPHRECL